MNPYQMDVQKFHEATGLPVGDLYDPEWRDRRLRAELIMEEAAETCEALGFSITYELASTLDDTPDWEGFVDGLCDLLYVTFGAAVTMGIDLDEFWAEVQRANMAKAGGPVRADGKRLKPPGWTPPDHKSILDRVVTSSESRT